MIFVLDSSWLAQVSSPIIACVSMDSLCREKFSASIEASGLGSVLH
jgi:hypothetical protein